MDRISFVSMSNSHCRNRITSKTFEFGTNSSDMTERMRATQLSFHSYSNRITNALFNSQTAQQQSQSFYPNDDVVIDHFTGHAINLKWFDLSYKNHLILKINRSFNLNKWEWIRSCRVFSSVWPRWPLSSTVDRVTQRIPIVSKTMATTFGCRTCLSLSDVISQFNNCKRWYERRGASGVLNVFILLTQLCLFPDMKGLQFTTLWMFKWINE